MLSTGPTSCIIDTMFSKVNWGLPLSLLPSYLHGIHLSFINYNSVGTNTALCIVKRTAEVKFRRLINAAKAPLTLLPAEIRHSASISCHPSLLNIPFPNIPLLSLVLIPFYLHRFLHRRRRHFITSSSIFNLMKIYFFAGLDYGQMDYLFIQLYKLW